MFLPSAVAVSNNVVHVLFFVRFMVLLGNKVIQPSKKTFNQLNFFFTLAVWRGGDK